MIVACCDDLVGFMPVLRVRSVSNLCGGIVSVPVPLTKRALCLAMHSSYSSGDQGTNLARTLETLSMISGGATGSEPRRSLK